MSLGVGWLALLILGKRQCESPTAGIGAEDLTPTSFLFPFTYIYKSAEFGRQEANEKNMKNEKESN